MYSYMPFHDCICLLQEGNAFVCFFLSICALCIVFLRCDAYRALKPCGTVSDSTKFWGASIGQL